VRRGAVLRRELEDAGVRRLELAFTGFNVAEYGVWVSVLVYGFERGGATAAAIIAVAQLLPAAALAPVLARSIDHRGAAEALRCGYRLQAGALAATALLMLSAAPELLVYAAAVSAAVAVTTTRPAQAALVPALVGASERITAVNVLSGWVENAGVLAGPALAGLLIALDGPGAAVAACAVCTLFSAVLAVGIAPAGMSCPLPVELEEPSPRQVMQERGDLKLLISLLGIQYLVIGVLDVGLVVLAIRVLGLGAPGAGFLTAAFGAGGLVGSLVAVLLIGRRRLARPAIASALGWALMLALLGTRPTQLDAFLLLAAAGGARSLLDVSGRTILVRVAPAAVRGRVFGLLEGMAMLGLAAGSLLVPMLDALGGPSVALMAAALILAAIALPAVGALQRLEDSVPVPRASPSSAVTAGLSGGVS
jgi:MFS family permease